MDKDIDFLRELQQELKTQDHDCQAEPRFWAIMDYRWVVTDDGWHDRVSVFYPDSCESRILEDVVNEILAGEDEGEYSDEDLEELRFNHEMGFESGTANWLEQHADEDCYFVYEKEEEAIQPNTFFITKQEAKDHLKNNAHHYTNKAHTYAMTACRAPKVERLWKILEIFDWDSVAIIAKDNGGQ